MTPAPDELRIIAFDSTESMWEDNELTDGKIVILPSEGVMAICIRTDPADEADGEVQVHSLTRHKVDGVFGAAPDLTTIRDGRYASAVQVVQALVCQNGEGPRAPHYSTRYRLYDHFIPGRMRQREKYQAITADSSGVQQLWYSPDDTFVGYTVTGPRENVVGVHRDGTSIGTQATTADAEYELISYDLALTSIGEETQSAKKNED
jgi:hypothetical protein